MHKIGDYGIIYSGGFIAMILCDVHTHSNNSFDAENSVDEMCNSAIAKGFYAIAITDHCEAPFIRFGYNKEFGDFSKRIPLSYSQTSVAKKKYEQNIKVLSGIELGEPMHDLECTKRALSFGDFDFVLASLHNLKNMDDFYYIDFSTCSISEILKLYFNELAETASFADFDSLAHLTYPLRYIFEKTGEYPDLSPYQSVIDDIYKTLISNNKALEINTSGLFKPIGTTLPDEFQIKRYRELGGKLITIGSDAHTANALGNGIKEGIMLAHKCGFDNYVIFEKRKPVFIPIEL